MNVFKAVATLVSENPNIQFDFVTAGKRARESINRSGLTLVGDFSDTLKDTITAPDAREVSQFLQKVAKE